MQKHKKIPPTNIIEIVDRTLLLNICKLLQDRYGFFFRQVGLTADMISMMQPNKMDTVLFINETNLFTLQPDILLPRILCVHTINHAIIFCNNFLIYIEVSCKISIGIKYMQAIIILFPLHFCQSIGHIL